MNAIVNATKNTLSLFEAFIRTTFITIFLPWRTSYEPIHALLNSAEDQKDELTLTWRTQKLAELSYVGITVRPPSPRPSISFPHMTNTPASVQS
jgi:hypothetical protein